MAKSASKFGFVECADLISEQKYGGALKLFQRAVNKFLDSKSSPKRTEIARQLQQIGSALEETLKKAYGDKWESEIPKYADEGKHLACSFCGKHQQEVRKMIAGPSVHICDECVKLCGGIMAEARRHRELRSVLGSRSQAFQRRRHEGAMEASRCGSANTARQAHFPQGKIPGVH